MTGIFLEDILGSPEKHGAHSKKVRGLLARNVSPELVFLKLTPGEEVLVN